MTQLARLLRCDFAKQQLLACLKSLLELVNTTAGINEFLLTGEEGMAL